MNTELSCDNSNPEDARLAALQRYQVLDTAPEEVFDAITRLAAQLCDTPIAIINLLDAKRNWFKAKIGIPCEELPRPLGICEQVLLSAQSLVIPDTLLDPRYVDNPLVNGESHIRFYAGFPLLTPEGHVLGTLCVMDSRPHALRPEQLTMLGILAKEVMTQLELRRQHLPWTMLRNRLELILATAGEGIYGLDLNGCTTFANPAAAKMLGQDVSELLGQPAHTVFYGSAPDSIPADCPLYASLRDGEKYQDDDTQFQHRDGHRFTARYTSTPLLQNGELLGAVLVFKDISERKRTEALLRHSEERYRVLYEDNPLIYFTLDQEGIVLSINRFGAAFLGYEVAELVGLPGRQTVFEDDKALVRQKFRSGLCHPDQVTHWEVRKVHKSGALVWAREAMRVVQDDAGESVVLIVCQDISDLKRAETELQEEQQFLKAVLENIEDGILACDDNGTLTLFNNAARKFHGQAQTPLPPSQWANQYHWYQADGKTRMNLEDSPLHRALRGDTVRNLEMSILRKPEGTLRNVMASSQPLWNADHSRQLGAVAVLHDITKRKRAEQRLNYLAHYDTLTELPNRTLFYELLGQALQRAQADGTLVAVLLLDLDRFKRINDTLGRILSDLLLKAVAQRLLDCVREDDAVTRLAGDEFALILEGIVYPAGITRGVQRLLQAFKTPFQLDGHELFLTPSIGISVYPGDGDDAETLLARADTAMYRVKEQGRNGFQWYASLVTSKPSRSGARQDLEAALRCAMERDELLLHYQPVVTLASGRVSGVEALLRWQHGPSLVPRAQFVPLAEETGLILPLGLWALRSACAQACSWQKTQGQSLRVALKFSARQLQQPDLPRQVADILAETGLQPESLEMQFAEVALHHSEARATLRALHELGIQITIDDYGSGAAALIELRQCAAARLKIDQSFLRGVPADNEASTLVRAIVGIAHSLRLKVTAEGVETAAQLGFLRSLGCDEAQGYLFSKPLPLTEITKLLSGTSYAALLIPTMGSITQGDYSRHLR